MSIFLTDPGVGAWVSPDEGAPRRPVDCPFASPYMPRVTGDALVFCCRRRNDCLCLRRRSLAPVCLMPAMPGLSDLRVSRCGRYLYQLSGEADAVHARALATGELLYARRLGVFPRMMRQHPDGRALLVAGGSVSEAYLLRAPDMLLERAIATRGACFAADFWRGGLVLVCALEGEDIQTAVYTLAPRAARPRSLVTLPGQPGALCVCPDGLTALLSTPDGLMKLDLRTGRLLWNLPEWALCLRLAVKGGLALVSAALNGQACLLRHEQPWIRHILASGGDAEADMG